MLDSMLLLGLLAFFPVAISLFTYALFWYETASSPYREALDRMSGGRSRWWIMRGIFSSALSSFFVLVTYPLGYLRGLWNPAPDQTCLRPPVILVHGLYHNASAWIILRRATESGGIHQRLRAELLQLDAVLPRVARSTRPLRLRSEPPFSRQAGHTHRPQPRRLSGNMPILQRHPNTGKVATLVTLGTPYHGSKLAALGLGKLAQSLAYHGPARRRRSQTARTWSLFRCWLLYSPVDNMVLPFDALLPEGNHWELEPTVPISHVAMLYHGGTASKVIDHLRSHEEGAVPA